MITKVRDFIDKHHMLDLQDGIVVGVSGGADSVCLLLVLLQFVEEYQLNLHVVHVNHGIRGEEAKNDEEYVKALCEEFHLPLHNFAYDVREYAQRNRLSEEEAGRKLRYEAFTTVSREQNCNKIAVAHHENDLAETVLFQLFRGSGIHGLAGIPPIRENIIRPLLCVSRDEIETFLERKKVAYCIDSTNLTGDYTRNKIRNVLLPFAVNEINAKSIEHISSAAIMLKEIKDYVKKNAFIAYDRIVRVNNGKYLFNVNEFQKEDIVVRKEIVRNIFMNLSGQLKDMEELHVELVLGLMEKQVGKTVHLPYNMVAKKGYHDIVISLEDKAENKQHSLEIEAFIPGRYYIDEDFGELELNVESYKKNSIIPENDYTKWFDYDKIKNTVVLRNRQEGDYFIIDSMGNRKKLKSFLIDSKVPKEERDNIPLLADGKHIVWIIGHRISEAYKIDETTTNILIAKIDGGNKNVR